MNASLSGAIHARQLGEEGMQLALALEPEDWIAAALDGLKAFGSMPGWHEFKTEDFRAWFKREPHSHKVWGGLTNRACKEGILEWTGRYAASVSPKTHGHPVKVWRFVFFDREKQRQRGAGTASC